MSPFEYLTVLISIILGMGITKLLRGVTNIIIRWEKVVTYWPHSVLVLLIFVAHIQDWWATYELHKLNHWRLPVFLFMILFPINLYILARILFPANWTMKNLDLKGFYFQNYRRIFLLMIPLPLHSILENHFIGGYDFQEQPHQILLLVVLSSIVIFNRADEGIHKTLAIFFLISTIVTFIVAWDMLLITI
jgi:hypothetical protein